MQVTYPDEYVWNIKQGSQLWFIMSAQSKDSIFMHFQSRVSPVKARQKIPFTVSLHVKDIQNKTETHWKACVHILIWSIWATQWMDLTAVGDGSLRLRDKSLFVGLEIILHHWCILRLKVAHSLFESKLNCLLRSLCMHLCGRHFHRSTFSVAHPGQFSAVATSSSSSGGTPSCSHPCPVCLWASSLLGTAKTPHLTSASHDCGVVH